MGAGPGRFPWVTAAMAVAMVGAFLLSGTGESGGSWAGQLELLRAGAKSHALVFEAHEPWRIATYHFVHTSWLHLAFNLAFLFPVGGALELVIRRTHYATLLIAVALVSGFASLAATPEVSAGASGLVFGLLGASVAFGVRQRGILGRSIRHHFGLWVLPFLVVILWLTAGNPTVDHASHLGGLAAGVLLGPWLRPRRPQPELDFSRPAGLPWVAVGAVVLGAVPVLLMVNQWQSHVLPEGPHIEVPATWHQGYGPLGTHLFAGAGGLVEFEVEAVAFGPSQAWAEQTRWYEQQRLQPLAVAGLIDGVQVIPSADTNAAASRVAGSPPPRFQRYRFVRDGTARVREVVFVPSAQSAVSWIVASWETPADWVQRYAETKGVVLGSMLATAAPGYHPARGGQARAAAAIP